ncbi:fungal-specific transcription factor domain-containing protein [Stachybotrys elegans]|uniref:Fungal-specific transcription factor domain-containing protein n=1 Tax=Stachybotrys elegans TaxID=80388 RepID=A0A8K0WNL4_9HYPO|nr:fungal-specific transcription factor domain-containing protein [Stachybotrys elegans]
MSAAAAANVPTGRSRKYVSRACDWCRVRRIKCDNGQPCKACLHRGEECTTKGFDEPRTLPQALREIDRLKQRVKTLEAELITYKSRTSAHLPSPQSLQAPSTPSVSPSSVVPQHTPSLSSPPKPQWQGILVATARTEQPAYYGPTSSFFFVSRLANYLANSLQQPLPLAHRNMQLRASKNMHVTDSMDVEAAVSGDSSPRCNGETSRPLTRKQEESLIKIYWESYHCFLPIIDEFEFLNHYASLWEPSREQRRQSPLADMILALCLQYGYGYIPREVTHPCDRDPSYGDAAVAGRWYYRRAQHFLTADLESPSLTTVQCYILMTVYLCCASFQNMCQITTGQAIRTAHVIGLHLEPPAHLPHGQQELRRRVWWTLWTIDTKISCKLGRPFIVDLAQVTVREPSADLITASYNSVTLGSYGPDVTWLSFSQQCNKLYMVVASIYEPFVSKCGEVVEKLKLSSLYADPDALESCAEVLDAHFPAFKAWVANVPDHLKMRRCNDGEVFSTDHSAAEFQMLAPTWLKRQRLCLELIYHIQAHNLSRPLVTFSTQQHQNTPLTDRYTGVCIDHAVAYTILMHQAVTESDLMSGWCEYFSLQWNAAITLLGFVLAKPHHPHTVKARMALDKALVVFDTFAPNFVVSADAARIVRTLLANVNQPAPSNGGGVSGGGGSGGGGNSSGSSHVPQFGVENGPAEMAMSNLPSVVSQPDQMGWLDPNQQIGDDYYWQVMNWGLLVDSYNSFDNFFDISK